MATKKPDRLKVGDVIEVPLPNGKKGFIQYVHRDRWGDIIKIFDFIKNSTEPVNVNEISTHSAKYYPILTRIKPAIKTPQYAWKIIKNIPVKNFTYPNFVWKEGGRENNQSNKWYLYNGVEDINIGNILPNKYKNLEYKSNYPPISVIDLILDKEVLNRVIDQEMIRKG